MCNLDRVLYGSADWQRTAIQSLTQRLPFEQLRHDVGCAVMLADVVDREDVGMVQCRGRTSFLEALETFSVA